MAKLGRNDRCPCGSNKKYKNCCMPLREAEVIENSPKKAQPTTTWIADLMQEAGRRHRSGQLVEARKIYQQVLDAAPGHLQALHLLGVIAQQTGDNRLAVVLIGSAIRGNPADPIYHCNLGLAHYGLGQLDQAVACYRRAIQIAPRFAEALNNLGNALRDQGKLKEATACFAKALQIRPDYADAHNNLGNALRDRGELHDAIASFRRAIDIRPEFADAYVNLSSLLKEQGRIEDAIAGYRKAISIKPGSFEAQLNLGNIYLQRGNLDDAIAAFRQSLAAKSENFNAWRGIGMAFEAKGLQEEAIEAYKESLAIFVGDSGIHHRLAKLFQSGNDTSKAIEHFQQAIRFDSSNSLLWIDYSECLRSPPAEVLNRVHVPTLIAALKNDDVDPQNMARVSLSIICLGPVIQQLLAMANDANEALQKMESLIFEGGAQSFFEMPLLLAALEQTILMDFRFEKLLTLVRHALLSRLARGVTDIGESLERFVSALAIQCFATEYIYAESEQEAEALLLLQERMVCAMRENHSVPASWLMLFGAYRALHRLDIVEGLQYLDWPEGHLRAAVEKLVKEPLAEAQIKDKGIPRLTIIGDEISQAVQKQYEEMPYPRWRRRRRIGKGDRVSSVMRSLFPKQEFSDNTSDNTEILVAGCGTGSESVQVAWLFERANILAIDLSASSLAYAIRATNDLAIENIQYQQADILELRSIGRQFDVVVSSGVLHHLRDPMAGWKVLADLLRPGGYMKISLYSRRARKDITATRKLIEESGYPPTAVGIRRCRSDIASGKLGIFSTSPWSKSLDFYNMSACRDLLFHVQEHLFSPFEIDLCINQLGLRFLGFEWNKLELLREYQARFPDDPACVSLSNWELFEKANPYAFSGMYQFWLAKDRVGNFGNA